MEDEHNPAPVTHLVGHYGKAALDRLVLRRKERVGDTGVTLGSILDYVSALETRIAELEQPNQAHLPAARSTIPMNELDDMVSSAIEAAIETSPEFNHGWRSMPDKELIPEIIDEIPAEYTEEDVAGAIYRYKVRRLMGEAPPQSKAGRLHEWSSGGVCRDCGCLFAGPSRVDPCPGPTPSHVPKMVGRRFVNIVDQETYVVTSEVAGFLHYEREDLTARHAPRYLGRAEFDKRFRPADTQTDDTSEIFEALWKNHRDELLARVAKLEAALKPFAEAAGRFDGVPVSESLPQQCWFTPDSLREARAAFMATTESQS